LANTKVTQEYLEILSSGVSTSRATQESLEIFSSGFSTSRATQEYLEILSSHTPPFFSGGISALGKLSADTSVLLALSGDIEGVSTLAAALSQIYGVSGAIIATSFLGEAQIVLPQFIWTKLKYRPEIQLILKEGNIIEAIPFKKDLDINV
jgi:hypothetical protein